MENISIESLLKIINGKLLMEGEASEINGVSIDSRKINPGNLYIPIKGEKNDGHIFIESAVEMGASTVLTETIVQTSKKVNVILVESGFKALKEIACYLRNKYNVPIIAITGSSGKTTTKDLVASVLSQKFNVIKTAGNFNNEYGIPQTLLKINDKTELAVIEMGMDHIGEIENSIGIVKPDISIITNIGTAHLEQLGSQENILKAKMEILSQLSAKGIALLNGDDRFLRKIKKMNKEYSVFYYGTQNSSLNSVATDIQNDEGGLKFKIKNENYEFKLPGKHNVYNCQVAIWIGKYFNLSKEEIQKGLDAYSPSANRMDILHLKNKIVIINDVYNANPDAMMAAIDTLQIIGKDGRKVAVLGDMLEMGDVSQKYHMQIGRYLLGKSDALITIGDNARYYAEGARSGVNVLLESPDANAAASQINGLIKKGDTVLLKASRGMNLENVLDSIIKKFGELNG